MTKPFVSKKTRQVFEEMFTNLGEARTEGRREDVARVMYALAEPMLPAQQAMNVYKRRMIYATESGDTMAGLAAVSAFQRDLLACAVRDAPAGLLRAAKASMLKKAADTVSAGAYSRELGLQPSPMAEMSMARGFEVWLDEKLADMDAEIDATPADEHATPSPR